jgi:hypothetical protein
MEEEASTASKEEEEHPAQWQPGSEVAVGGAPYPLVSEDDLQPKRVKFESMEAVRDAIKSFCWRNSYPFYVRQSDPKRFVVECPSTMKKKVKKIKTGDGEGDAGSTKEEEQGEGHVAGQMNEEVAGQMNEEVAGQTNEEVAGQTNEEVAGQTNVEVAGQTNEEMNEEVAGWQDERRGCRQDEQVYFCDICSSSKKDKQSCRYHQAGPGSLLRMHVAAWHEGVGGYSIRHGTGTGFDKGCTWCGSCSPPGKCTQMPRCPCELHDVIQGKEAN